MRLAAVCLASTLIIDRSGCNTFLSTGFRSILRCTVFRCMQYSQCWMRNRRYLVTVTLCSLVARRSIAQRLRSGKDQFAAAVAAHTHSVPVPRPRLRLGFGACPTLSNFQASNSLNKPCLSRLLALASTVLPACFRNNLSQWPNANKQH